ncbi:fused histidine kinase with gaf domain/response regulator receiver [Halogeometricum borinquense DSM 11551]|uniref:histidine kinase n=1 Tax=Halogeometricum borinquense (strain ATCC 700274 / DSM 11551 / JCM 10706 / KCTC 4070 / PR3) TaxID=469382 RepID=E4NQB3_HALBP|nr:ATP-binding protein [Halogeometricum borinquense]ADQ66675.1 fused histidine kinase with GAF domain/response regulator receiver [Halogeometricum borinquense DSM 11551]ELY30184.1 fused histidine kinase with gaf domain/response regulator receiver [Halogeometricum borinquense DSM 11551]
MGRAVIPDAPVRVLYVDGDSDYADRVRSSLVRESLPFDVQTAPDAECALEHLRESDDVHCIVSEYQLPDTTGLAFYDRVREFSSDLPFILFTASGSEEIASDAVSAGVTDYLLKREGSDQFEVLADRIGDAVCSYRTERRIESERQAVFDRMADAFFAVNADWHVTVLNEQAKTVLTAAMDDDIGEIEGRHLWEELPDAVGTTFYEKYHEAMENQEPVSFEEYYEPLDTWFEVRVYPSETGLSVYYRDITERYRQREMLESRERVLREMHDIIAACEKSFTEQVEAVLELGREELGTEYGTLSEIRGDDYIFEVVATDDERIQAGDVVPVSVTNCERCATAEKTLVLGDISQDSAGRTGQDESDDWGIACYLGAPVFVDDDVYGTFCFYGTTPRDDQFSEWEVTLVDLMSRWVSYELQRRQTNEKLRAQNEKLGQFASIVSHDLRNPLNVARGHIELAQNECTNEHLDAVERAHDRMETLIENLLTLARSEERIGDTELVNLAELAEQCWETVETGTASLDVETDRTLLADEPRLRQLLENLMRNSVEHGSTSNQSNPGHAADADAADSQRQSKKVERGAESVTVRVGDVEGGFYVEDDGPGIPPDERASVFDSSHTTKTEGTGLGLAIVERIAKGHGWSVCVTEGTGGGARFEFTDIETVSEAL